MQLINSLSFTQPQGPIMLFTEPVTEPCESSPYHNLFVKDTF